MGRELRMVPADWQHPKAFHEPSGEERYVPLLPFDHAESVRQWEQEELPEWLEGERLWREEGKVKRHDGRLSAIAEVIADTDKLRRPETPSYRWWAGERPERPDPAHYMPNWPNEQRTHFMMYEDTSEGTPISPVFATAEELARWLADNKASAFADQTATYEEWLSTIKRGWAFSGVITVPGGRIQSGVSALNEE